MRRIVSTGRKSLQGTPAFLDHYEQSDETNDQIMCMIQFGVKLSAVSIT
jgi:hypothetical protein